MIADNSQKTPLAGSLQDFAQRKAADAIQMTGKALPCSVVAINGSIVTVKFEVNSAFTLPQVTVPKAESQWIRMPTQIGDYGVVMPADAYLGGVSGLGGGTADLSRRANLTPLVFMPIANKNFASVNTNAAYIAGPQGAVIQTADGKSSIAVNDSGITVTFSGKTWTFNGTGFTMSSGIVAETHQHDYIPGSGAQTTTSAPVA